MTKAKDGHGRPGFASLGEENPMSVVRVGYSMNAPGTSTGCLFLFLQHPSLLCPCFPEKFFVSLLY